MRLVAQRDMRVRVAELDLTVDFAAGEEMCTEISAKFRIEKVSEMLQEAGFAISRIWTDPDDRFALTLATACERAYHQSESSFPSMLRR